MHGRKRDEYKAIHRDPTMIRKLSTKAVAWHTLQHELLSLQKQPTPTPTDVTTATTTISSNDHPTNDINTLVLLEKAVTVNPDPIWLWNFRRTLIERQLQSISSSPSSASSVDPTCRIFEKEHEITQLGLQNNPKAYAVWHYRKWCIQQQIRMIIPTTPDVVVQLLQTELHLCHFLLQKDERNFHCWSYRRFVVSCCISYHDMVSQTLSTSYTTASPIMTGEWILPLTEIDDDDDDDDVVMGAQIALRYPLVKPFSVPDLSLTTDSTSCMTILKQEWEFTTTKIYENFSNFSAFHYRSKLLPLMIQMMQSSSTNTVDTSSIPTDSCDDRNDQMTFQMIKDEFDLITNAIYTEPDDQTAWWYQVFLFHYLTNHVLIRKNANLETLLTKYNEQIVEPHLQQVRELKNETNSSSKWVLIGLLQGLQYLKKCHFVQRLRSVTAVDHVDFDDMRHERRMILQTLIQIDPDRKERYKYKLRQIR